MISIGSEFIVGYPPGPAPTDLQTPHNKNPLKLSTVLGRRRKNRQPDLRIRELLAGALEERLQAGLLGGRRLDLVIYLDECT